MIRKVSCVYSLPFFDKLQFFIHPWCGSCWLNGYYDDDDDPKYFALSVKGYFTHSWIIVLCTKATT